MKSLALFLLVLALFGDAAFASRLVSDRAISLRGLKAESASDKRPLYVISHRTNGISTLKEALTPINQAANALEIDVRYGKPLLSNKLTTWYIDHDGVFSWSTELPEWIDAVNEYINQGADVSLLILDTKTTDCGRLCVDELRDIIRKKLNPQVTIIYSVATYEERDFYEEIYGVARNSPNEGFSIDYDNNPQRVQDWFVSKNISNFYYGNGDFELIPDSWSPNVFTGLVQAGKLRDSEKKIKKTYAWTMKKESTMLRYLQEAQVDGIMANPAQIPILRRAALQVGRIATPQDNPFTVFTAASKATVTAPGPLSSAAGFDINDNIDVAESLSSPPPAAPASSSASQALALVPPGFVAVVVAVVMNGFI